MRRSAKSVYVAVAIISIILYMAGIMTGINIQQSVSKSVEEDLASIKSDIENQQQEFILFSLRGKESCVVLQSLSSSTASRLDSASNEIRQLEQGQNNAQFNAVKELYSTLSIRAWVLKSAINENCNDRSLSILYYYSFPCDGCKLQEASLEYIKSLAPDRIFTYAVDKDVNNTLVQTLVKSHNIVSAPAIVIHNNVYEGVVNTTRLEEIACLEINVSCPNTNTTLNLTA